eukprot:435033-Pleurochrysis_carterae.AAC.1
MTEILRIRGCIGSTQPVAHLVKGGGIVSAQPRRKAFPSKPSHHHGGSGKGGCRRLPPPAPHPLSAERGIFQ